MVRDIRQGGAFNRNTVIEKTSHGGSAAPYLAMLAAGGAVGIALAFWVVATLIGAAVALAVVILGSAAAVALLGKTGASIAIEVAHYRKTGEVPQRQPLVQLGGKRPAVPAIEAPVMPAIEQAPPATWADVYEAQGRDRETAHRIYDAATYYGERVNLCEPEER